jgi:hypothetical protein
MEELANASRVNGAVSDFLMAGRELFPEVAELDMSKSSIAAPVARRLIEGSNSSPSLLRMGTNRKADSIKTEPVRAEPVKAEPVTLPLSGKAEPEKPLKPLPPIPRSAQLQHIEQQQQQQQQERNQSDEEEEESTN